MTEATDGVEAALRVGVVGIGVMGSNHARVLREMPGVELVGVADPDPKQAAFVGGALGCKTVSDVKELIALWVDAVSIAAPTHLHRDIALTCINNGVHVLVEKPIAPSVKEGREIIVKLDDHFVRHPREPRPTVEKDELDKLLNDERPDLV